MYLIFNLKSKKNYLKFQQNIEKVIGIKEYKLTMN